MADILIRGMEMPTQCGNCPISTNTRRCTILWREFGNPSKRLEGCPLVPLPEGHGRLIDADALIRDMFTASDGTIMRNTNIDGWHFEMRYKDIKKHIRNAPTIVPAEGGTDDVPKTG